MEPVLRLRLVSNLLAALIALIAVVFLFCGFDPHGYLPGMIFIAVHFHLHAVRLSKGVYGLLQTEEEFSRSRVMLGAVPFVVPIVFGMVRIFTLMTLSGDNIRLDSIFNLFAWLVLGAAYISGPLMWYLTVRHFRLKAEKAKGKPKRCAAVQMTMAELIREREGIFVEDPAAEAASQPTSPRRFSNSD